MEEQEVKIQQLNPNNFEFQDYIESDENLIASSDLDTVFNNETDYIEYYVYDENNSQIYPSSAVSLSSYKVIKGDVILNPTNDLRGLGFDDSTYSILYNFYRKRLNSDLTQQYYIKEISSDRTEIRLDSNTISNLEIITSTNEFIQYRSNSEYFVDFLLNFDNNKTIIANNIKLEDEETDDPTILIKLYEPLPQEFDLKSTLWVVEEVSTPQMYKVSFPFIPLREVNNNFISGPNFNLSVKDESGVSGQLFDYDSLVNTNITSSANQLQTLLDQKEVNINVNYENYNDFVYFSSANTRLENFAYKVGRIEHFTNQISASLGKITGDTTSSFAYSASKASYETSIKDIINNFDGYEYFLYYNSGSLYSWPKKNDSPPYNLYSTGSTEALEWLGSANPSSQYYGGQALSASNYDESNQNYLYWAIPEYLRDDENNDKYLLFVDMVAQQYDNTWLYTKDLTNKFNADNRLEYGISRDLVADAIKDFGIKLYSNNFNTDDLYTTFLGLTPSGSLFPFPNITGSLPTPSGYEYVDTRISSSNDPISLDGTNKRLYKRIYHNLPYLIKTKGTVAGIRALITSYGIPDTILRINEFGGKDRINSQDWDLQQRVFNYAFDTKGEYIISSSFDPNSNLDGGYDSPRTVQLRFKTNGLPSSTHYSQSLYHLESGTSALILEYTGSGLDSGSYSGSIAHPENKYGTLKFIPNLNTPSISASLYFPFFDGNWWSVQTTVDTTNTASLTAANQINKKLGFTGSDTIVGLDSNYYFNAAEIYFPTNGNDLSIGGEDYTLFSGSYQEIRYYNSIISSSVFYDYVMNPYSFEGNSLNTAPNELIFRADLGTLIDTGSTTSVHPKITGSSEFTTQSFASNSEYYISSSNFVVNREYIHQDQVVAGIKNRVTDKITTNNLVIPSGDTLSSMRSIQQSSFESSSYTPDINYLEVAYSPQDQINDDINSQMGYFNIGEYIGDPRHISQSGRNYPDLDTLRDAYFNKYMDSYDLVDFIRLIKFFDNSLFKMIKDFTPARTSLSSGVVVKQHILERNRVRPAQASYENITYSGSLKPQVRNYSTGSGEVGAYEYVSGSSIYRFSGGTGGSFERFNGLEFSPSASDYDLSNRFGITQSFTEAKIGKLGKEVVTIFNQDEFYDGEFSGSHIIATTQSLVPGCTVYLKNPDKPLNFFPYFYSDPEEDSAFGTVKNLDWQERENAPLQGQAWFYSKFNPNNGKDEVNALKVAARDINGNEVRDFLLGAETIQFAFGGVENEDQGISIPGQIRTYFVDGVQIFANYALVRIRQNAGDYDYAFDDNGGTENWSLRAYGDYSASNDETLAGVNYNSQNIFHALSTFQRQFIRYYNGGGDENNASVVGDPLDLFDSGSDNYLNTPLIDNETGWNWGSYNLPRTPNIPLVISCSVSYSASGGGEVDQSSDTSGIYHTGSFYGNNSYDQTVEITPRNKSNGIYISSTGQASAAAAQTQDLDNLVYFTGSVGSTPSAPVLANGTLIHTKPRIIPLNNFNGGNLFYRIGDNHTAQITIGGQINNLTLFQGSGNPSPVLANLGFSGSFALPSVDTNKIDLDETFYNVSINQNLPAYSGSGANTAGVPQLKADTSTTPATASLYWKHDEYTLGGTAPGPVPILTQTIPFSGSSLTSNADFSDTHTGGVSPDATYAEFVNKDGDGVYEFNVTNFQNFVLDQGGGGGFAGLGTMKIQFDVEFDRYESGISVAVQQNANGQGFLTMPFTSVNMSSFNNKCSNGAGTQIGILSPAPGGPDVINKFRLVKLVNGEISPAIGYRIINFQITLYYDRFVDQNNDGNIDEAVDGVQTVTEVSLRARKGTSTSNNDFETTAPKPSLYAEAETTSYLYITGSDGTPDLNPKQPVARSIGVRGPITGSGVIRFPDSTLDKIYRTASITYDTITQKPVSSSTFPYQFRSETNILTPNLPGYVKFDDSNLENATTMSITVVDNNSDARDFNGIEAFKIIGSNPGDSITVNNARILTVGGDGVPSYKFAFDQGNVTSSGFFTNGEDIKVFKSIGNSLEWINPNYIGNGEAEYSSSISTVDFFDYPDGITIPVKDGTTPKYSNGGTTNTISSSANHTLYPTVNTTQSMFFPLYEFSHITGSIVASFKGTTITPRTNNLYPIIAITNSINTTGDGYDLTGSIEVWKGDKDNLSSPGTLIFSDNFIVENSESIDVARVSGSVGLGTSNFKYNDTFRMAISVDKSIGSRLDITQYTMSLFPSESKFASITENPSNYGEAEYGDDTYGGNAIIVSPDYNKFSPPTNTEVILSSYYGEGVLPFALMLDCQPLINNYNAQRPSTYLMDVDYNSSIGGGITTQVNISPDNNIIQIIDSAVTASIVKGQEIKYNDEQFEGTVTVTGRQGLNVSVNRTSNQNAGADQTVTFRTPSFGSLFPVNFQQILSGSAIRATVPDSNYYQESWSNPRYNGVKTTSLRYNTWTVNDKNTYGQLPVIELKTAYFGYFNSLQNLYPLYNDVTMANVTYFIDQQGNAIPPTLNEGFGKTIVEKAFNEGDLVTFTLNSGSTELNEMDDEATIIRVGQKPFPVLYTQNGGRTYATSLNFSGSGRLSLYDNNDGNSFHTYTFQAEGTSSFEEDFGPLPVAATTTAAPNFIFQTLNPGTLTSQFEGINEYTQSYTASGDDSGSITFPSTEANGNDGDNLSNPTFLEFQTSFATSFLYEGHRKRRNDGDELKIQVIMEVDGEGTEFALEDMSLRVHKQGGQVVDCGSVLGAGKGSSKFELVRFATTTTTTSGRGRRRKTTTSTKWATNTGYNTQTKSYYMSIENPALNAFMKNKGVYRHGTGDVQFRGDITGLEWVIKGNSGQYAPKKGETVKFKIGLSMLKSVSKNGSNIFYPSAYTGPVFPTKITAIGAKDHLLSNANTGSAPFWVFTGSAGNGSNVLDQSILVMSASIINEAYGGGYYQAPLAYTPGASDYFPNGQEPRGTQIGKPQSEVILQEGDEIRFQNSETYTYTIISVTPPQENIEAGDVPRLKIQLDREVDSGLNKDFFLIRRYKESFSSFILDQEFPYDSAQSASIGSGMIYPEYPASNLQISSSQIVTSLVSKGIIT